MLPPLATTLLTTAVAALLAACALAVAAHVVALLHLLWSGRGGGEALPAPLSGEDLPVVTVQLPLYNEPDVAVDLLRCVARLDWPRDRLEVQVLDDSTDETVRLVAREVTALRAGGLDAHHLRRSERTGFKAGALAHGLQTARGDLVAVLDADFRPDPDWLRRAVACLRPDDGLIQCRWAFRNEDRSILTRAQALHLDAHFALEQRGRSGGGLLMGFNGTAGIWRRQAIEDAGGWHADTLTEDLDLAYRAQLAGWRLRYEDRVAVPSDLPETLPAIRAQQHRWIRGGAQVARKLLGPLWRSDQPLGRKLQGTAHLLASSVFLPVLVLCLLTPVLPLVAAHAPAPAQIALVGAGWLLRGVLAALVLAYGTTCVRRAGRLGAGLLRLARDLPVFLVLVTSIAVHDARAAWMGWTGPTGTFVRTPKGALERRLARRRLPATLPVEAVLAAWSVAGLLLAAQAGHWGSLPFLLGQAVGFSGLVLATLRDGRPRRAPAARATMPR